MRLSERVGRRVRAAIGIVTGVLLSAGVARAQPIVLRVDAANKQPGLGATWATAFNDLQQALEHGANLVRQGLEPVELWVAAGTYRPPDAKGVEDHFTLRREVSLYGGFNGVESAREQRTPALFDATVLTGERLGGGNVYQVIHAGDVDSDTTMDGFRITGGRALGPVVRGQHVGGALVVVDPQGGPSGQFTVRNCTFDDNRAREGGAVSFTGSGRAIFRNCRFLRNVAVAGGGSTGNGGAVNIIDALPVFIDCTFELNQAGESGGACMVRQTAGAARPDFINCSFLRNSAASNGGAMNVEDSTLTSLINCEFWDNAAVGGRGGALRVSSTTPVGRLTSMVNCTVANNTAVIGSGLFNANFGTLRISNSIVYHNSGSAANEVRTVDNATMEARFSCVRGGNPLPAGPQVIYDDPRFLDWPAGDLRLSSDPPPVSPCIDSGNNNYIPEDTYDVDEDGDVTEKIPVDLAGLQRIVRDLETSPVDTVNRGAYEAVLAEWRWRDQVSSGEFDVAGNWDRGSVPSGRSVAVFSPPTGTDVLFRRDEISYYLRINGGIVTFNLGDWDYGLLGAEPSVPAVLVGAPRPAAKAWLRVEGAGAGPRTFSAHRVHIGQGSADRGRLDVNRANTLVVLADEAHVGVAGQGELYVTSGASALSPGLRIATASTATGVLRVEDAGSALTYGVPERDVFFGLDGHASIQVQRSATLRGLGAGTLALAVNAGSTAEASISGATWIHSGRDLLIGDAGDASLTITGGGSFITESASRAVIASQGTSDSSVLVGGASRWHEALAPIIIGDAGSGSLRLEEGGVVEAPQGVRVRPSGHLGGVGTVRATLDVISTGEVAPGAASLGTLNIAGNYIQIGEGPQQTQLSGELRVRLQRDQQGPRSDTLAVSGTAELHGGLLADAFGTLDAEFGDVFEVLRAGALAPGERFDVAYLPGLSGLLYLTVEYDEQAGSVRLRVSSLDGSPNFGPKHPETLEQRPVAADVAELDNAGGPDLAVLFESGMYIILYNEGLDPNGGWLGFRSGTILQVGPDPRDVAIGNIDGNPGRDFAVACAGDDSVRIFANDGFGRFGPPLIHQDEIHTPVSLALGDFDGPPDPDRQDIVVANGALGRSSVILENRLGGIEPDPLPLGPAPSSVNPVRGGKGKNSRLFFGGGNDDVVTIYDQDTPGSWVYLATVPVGRGPVDVLGADLNLDTLPDFVCYNAIDQTVSVVVNEGNVSYAPAVNLSVGGRDPNAPIQFQRRLAIDDFDGDDDPDIAAIADDGTGRRSIAVLRNDLANGQLSFTLLPEVDPEGEPVAILSADLNGDTVPDLVTINAGGGDQFNEAGALLGGCYADCDTSTGPGVLDIFDFLCFQNRYTKGDPYACDCDTQTGPGVCDIFDFLCFQNAFVAGCK